MDELYKVIYFKELCKFKIEIINSTDRIYKTVIPKKRHFVPQLFVKDLEGNILKGIPIRITKPHRIEVGNK